MFVCRIESEKEHLWTMGGLRTQVILLIQGKLKSDMNIALWEKRLGENKRHEEHMGQTENDTT